MKEPLVSVIIPSYNSEKFIKRCLESIKKQTYKKIEVIVVDNSSKDKTREIAKQYTDRVFIYGPERSVQMNHGLAKAKGKYLYRVDSDFVLEPEVIEQCVKKCEKEKLDGIAVHNTSYPGLGFWAEVRKLERNTYIDDNLIVGVRFFSKIAWKKIGEFERKMAGPEDFAFHNNFMEAGFKYGRIKAIERHLGEPKSIRDIWNKFFYYGQSNYHYFRKYPTIATRQYIPIRLSYLRHFKKLISDPILFLGFIVMNIVKYTAGFLGFLKAALEENIRR